MTKQRSAGSALLCTEVQRTKRDIKTNRSDIRQMSHSITILLRKSFSDQHILDINWLSPVDLAVVPLLRPPKNLLADWLNPHSSTVASTVTALTPVTWQPQTAHWDCQTHSRRMIEGQTVVQGRHHGAVCREWKAKLAIGQPTILPHSKLSSN